MRITVNPNNTGDAFSFDFDAETFLRGYGETQDNDIRRLVDMVYRWTREGDSRTINRSQFVHLLRDFDRASLAHEFFD